MNKLALTLVAVLVTSLTSATAAKKAKVEFSRDLAGSYSGTYLITASGSGAGNVTARVTVPKSGKKLTVSLTGFISAGSTTIPIACNLNFDSKRKLRSDAALLGLFSPVPTSDARFTGKNGNFRFSLAAAPGATLNSSPLSSFMSYQLRFSNNGLTIVGNGVADTGSVIPVSVNATLRRQGKK